MRTLRECVEDWVSAVRRSAELDRLDSRELKRLATDVGLSVGELREFGGYGRRTAALLSRRLANMRLTHAAHAQPVLFRDMERVCLHCEAQDRCERDLNRNPLDPAWLRYCPNADALNSLQ
jgi:hypothetical protein